MLFFLDFSKAFDLVTHSKLISKLHNLCLPVNLIDWIRSYLHICKQYVKVNNCMSGILPVSSGVPQGSVLGPVPFLVYINDIVESIYTSQVHIKLFADDCILFKTINAPNDKKCLQSNLCAISKWCEDWSMKLNSDKSVVMHIKNNTILIIGIL